MNPCAKSKTNLFVNGISPNIDEIKIREIFSKCGTIKSVKIKRPFIPPNQRAFASHPTYSGIAYVDFSDESEAKKAIDELNGKEVDG